MKKVFLSVVLLFAALSFINAQSIIPDLSKFKTNRDKLEALADLCDTLAVAEDVEKEKIISLYALKLLAKNDWYYQSIFYYNLGYAWEDSRQDSAFYFHEKSLESARKSKNSNRIVASLERLLFNYNNTAGYKQKGRHALKEILNVIDTTRNDLKKSRLYATVGNYYFLNGQYETQIRYLIKAIEIKKKLIGEGKIKDREDVVVDLMSLSELYLDLEQGDKAIIYGKEARKYIVSYQPYFNHYYKDMLSAYLLLKQISNAKIYYDSLSRMITPGNKNAGRYANKIAADLTFADYYLSKNKVDSAEIYINRANDLAPAWAGGYLKSQVDYMTGTLLAAKKDYRNALPLLKTSEPLSAGLGLAVHAALLQSLAKSYAATGQWELAYNYYDKYAPLRDSLYREASKKSIADAEAIYQNKEKQQQIEIKNLQIEEARTERLWLISGVSFLALSLILLGIIYRNKKKNAEILDQKNHEMSKLIHELEESNRTKAKLFSIISHDLRSPISQVYQFLKLQQLNPKLLSESQRAELSERIQTATGSLLETMEDLLLWSKTQINQFKADIQPVEIARVVDQCLKLLQLNIEAKNIQIENRVPGNTLVETDPYYLQAIVRNLLQNAIKAADENSKIMLYLNDVEDHIVLAIENSGPAFSQEAYEQILAKKDSNQGLSGLGLRLVDELSVKTGLQIRFENPSSDLTRALIRF